MVQWPRVECFAIEGGQLLQVDGMAIHSSSTRVFPKRRLRPKGFPIKDHSRKLSATVDFSYRSTFQRRTDQWPNLESLLEGILSGPSNPVRLVHCLHQQILLRAIIVILEPTEVNEIRTETYHHLYHPKQLIPSKGHFAPWSLCHIS
uniref:Tubulin alpha-2 chain n=2 Tax=Culex pipiens TaxID=7175 RepID=A0A8D8P1T3_CULPI